MIYACALLDRLKADALAGDRAALERLLRWLPRDLAPAERAAERTRSIRRIAESLRLALPYASDRRIAAIIAKAGQQLDAGDHGLAGDLFYGLELEERRWLEVEIRYVLSWAPRRADGRGWPRFRQIQTIVAR